MCHPFKSDPIEEIDMTTTADRNDLQLDQDVTVHFHVSILEPADDEINSFWFDDAASLICDLERKLGATNGADVVLAVNELGIDKVHVAFSICDEKRLVITTSAEELERLMRPYELVDENPGMSQELAFSLVLDGRVGGTTPPRSDRAYGNREQRRSRYTARGIDRLTNR
jgi:hypothetical protein